MAYLIMERSFDPALKAVRQAFRISGLPFESVWAGDVLAPDAA